MFLAPKAVLAGPAFLRSSPSLKTPSQTACPPLIVTAPTSGWGATLPAYSLCRPGRTPANNGTPELRGPAGHNLPVYGYTSSPMIWWWATRCLWCHVPTGESRRHLRDQPKCPRPSHRLWWPQRIHRCPGSRLPRSWKRTLPPSGQIWGHTFRALEYRRSNLPTILILTVPEKFY